MAKRIDIAVSFEWPRDKIMQQIKQQASRAVDATVIETQARLMDKLSQYGSGKAYKRRGSFHRASRKGQPPAADTGMLRLSWTVGMKVRPTIGANFIRARMSQGTNFGSALKYAGILESKEGLDRPYLAPTVKEMKRERVLQRHLFTALKRAESVINAIVK